MSGSSSGSFGFVNSVSSQAESQSTVLHAESTKSNEKLNPNYASYNHQSEMSQRLNANPKHSSDVMLSQNMSGPHKQNERYDFFLK